MPLVQWIQNNLQSNIQPIPPYVQPYGNGGGGGTGQPLEHFLKRRQAVIKEETYETQCVSSSSCRGVVLRKVHAFSSFVTLTKHEGVLFRRLEASIFQEAGCGIRFSRNRNAQAAVDQNTVSEAFCYRRKPILLSKPTASTIERLEWRKKGD